jgi:hypothetical protein
LHTEAMKTMTKMNTTDTMNTFEKVAARADI